MRLRLSLALSGSIAASGCFAVPPTRTAAGSGVDTTTSGSRFGYRVAAGAHSSSIEKKPTAKIDLGAGYLYERFDLDPEASGDHGSYLSLSLPIATWGKSRVWIGGQAELFWLTRTEHSPDRGLTARVALERFVAGGSGGSRGGGSGGAFYGSTALELYLEVGVRATVDESVGALVLGGVSLRLPMLVGAGRPSGLGL